MPSKRKKHMSQSIILALGRTGRGEGGGGGEGVGLGGVAQVVCL